MDIPHLLGSAKGLMWALFFLSTTLLLGVVVATEASGFNKGAILRHGSGQSDNPAGY